MGKKKAGGAEKLSPVFAACDEDDLEELLSLLKSQPSVRDSRNRDGWTPLHQACYAGSEACARALLEAGAKASLKDTDGDSPAHYASAQGHVGCLRILLKAGADLEAVDNDGESVLDVADGARTRTALRKLIEEAAAAESEEDGEAWEEAEPGEEEEEEVVAQLAKLEVQTQQGAPKKPAGKSRK